MTVKLVHTALIDDPETPEADRPGFDEIWDSMLYKAEHPVDFVPSITECTVVERYPDGFLREVVFYGKDRVRERVTPDRGNGRIAFELIDNPEMTVIYNDVDEDTEGRRVFTLTYVLADERVSKNDYLQEFDRTVRETAEQTAATLRNTAAATTSPA